MREHWIVGDLSVVGIVSRAQDSYLLEFIVRQQNIIHRRAVGSKFWNENN